MHAGVGCARTGRQEPAEGAFQGHHVGPVSPLAPSSLTPSPFTFKSLATFRLTTAPLSTPPVVPCSYFGSLSRQLPRGEEQAAIRAMFASRNMLAFEGMPRDVQAIQQLLVSEGYFGSAEAFNTQMRAKLVALLSEHFA